MTIRITDAYIGFVLDDMMNDKYGQFPDMSEDEYANAENEILEDITEDLESMFNIKITELSRKGGGYMLDYVVSGDDENVMNYMKDQLDIKDDEVEDVLKAGEYIVN